MCLLLELNDNSFNRSRAHIQRCNGESDPVTTLTVNPPEEDGCSLESGDVDEQESNQLDVVRIDELIS